MFSGKTVSVLLCIGVSAALLPCAPVSAEDAFIGKSYTLFSYNSSDGALYPWLEDTGDGEVRLSGTADLAEGTGGLPGRTYVSFEVTADEINEPFTFDIETGDEAAGADVSLDGSGVVRICGSEAGKTLPGQDIEFEFCIDAGAGTVGICVSDAFGTVCSDTVDTGAADTAVTGLTMSGGGEIFINNIDVLREDTGDGKNVIFGSGGYIRAAAKAEKGEYLYLVRSVNGIPEDIKISENVYGSERLEACLPAAGGGEYSAFVWDEKMTPADAAAKAASGEIKDITETPAGSISVSDTHENKETALSVTVPEGYDGAFVLARSESGAEKVTDSGGTAWTPEESGYYDLWLYVKDGDINIPAANTRVFVSPELKENDSFIFPCEKNYYVHNGEKVSYPNENYVPLVWDGDVFLNAEYIKRLTGIEITEDSVYYDGDRLAGINSEAGKLILADGSESALSVRNGNFSFGDIAVLLGYETVTADEAVAVTRGESLDIDAYEDILNEYIIKNDIEGVVSDWTGIDKPEGWSFYNWSASQHTGDDKTAGVARGEGVSGGDAMYIGAVQSVYAGFTIDTSDIDFDGYLYEVSFDVKYSGDAQNVYPRVLMQMFDNGQYKSMVSGSSVEGKVGEWTRVYSYITREQLDSAGGGPGSVIIALAPSVQGSAAGRIYFDNFTLREKSILSEASEANIACEAFGAWHVLGEDVSFRSENGRLDGFEAIKGCIYDIDDEKVYEHTISKRAFMKEGWLWTPSEPGYYEAEFYGIRSDGSESLIVNCYTAAEEDGYKAYNVARHGIAVTKEETKPMDERSGLLMLSDDASNEDELRLADLVGFSGIRIHYIPWGDTAARKGFEPQNGVFDWTETDKQIENIKKFGFENVVANIIATPVWAVSEDKGSGNTVVGFYRKNCYVPDDITLAGRAFGAYAERYKDEVDAIEVWNEPNYGFSAFWGDTVENFAALTNTAYNAVKEKTEGKMKVYSAGFNGGSEFFAEAMGNADYKNSFDGITYHGRYNQASDYKNVLENAGKGDVPVMNSESYDYAYYDPGVPKDFRTNDMYLAACYLNEIKNGAESIAHFEITDGNNDEKRVDSNSSYAHCTGIFRKYPYYEPHSGAVAAYNLFKGLGDEVAVTGEYDFGSGIKAVALDSDGEAQLYIWNSRDEEHAMPARLSACIGAGSDVYDLYGRSFGGTIEAKSVYCIRNADRDAISKLTSVEGTALNNDFVRPYYTCVDESGQGVDGYVPVEGVFTEGALFDKNTFAGNDGIVYNSDSPVWLSENGGMQDISAEYAVSFDDTGMYVAVNVEDAEYYAAASDGNGIIENDGIRFAIDCYGNASASERSEFFAGNVNGSPEVYKYFAAEKYGALADGCTEAGELIQDSSVSISRDGSVTEYKVFLPYAELFPFVYRSGAVDEVRFAIAVTDNDGGVKKGVLSFGEGLADGTVQVGKYNLLKPIMIDASLTVSADILTVSGRVLDGSDRLSLTVKKDGALYNIDQIDGIEDGYFEKSFKAEPGEYSVMIMTDRRSVRTLRATVSMIDADLSVSGDTMTVRGKVLDGSDRLSLIVKKDGEVYNIDQIDGIEDGYFEKSFKAGLGRYSVMITTDKRSVRTFDII